MTENAGLSSIEAYDDLREAVGEPTASIAEKEMPMLDKHARHFLSLSPILFISTVGVDGRADISPRGDPAGFVKVIDDRTILIPERPGNRRVDTMSNIVENPGHSVALIFLLPGVEETLRASGLGGVPLMLSFVLLSSILNLLMGSASAKWAVMAPVFVPMFMLLGYSPELTQAAYRIGDSTSNVIAPMMSYFALIVAFFERYDKTSGIGTVVATMLPYTVVFLACWSLMLVVWMLLGLPVGPGAGLYLQ